MIPTWSGLRCTVSLSMEICSSSMTAPWFPPTNSPRRRPGRNGIAPQQASRSARAHDQDIAVSCTSGIVNRDRPVQRHGRPEPIWPCAALVNIRVAAGHGLGALAKMAAVIEAATADRIAASAGVRSGLQGTDHRQRDQLYEPEHHRHRFSLPFLRAGEKITRPAGGSG